ncbi:hypothetical protein F2P81_002894 [Scophthalmus maximus]|uniref:PB1 domain-containing protein n=1 Tax=Scophthalmus maximus TaxID=52904 RepID=A0A6A4TM44_SCOMX|nr:hypothetical protein F2P81_002894 [Scophthalmus maximus]
MDLKEIVQLVLSPSFTEESIGSYECWYSEHLRSFELTSSDNFSVNQLSQLNDTDMAAQIFLLHVHTSMDIVRKMTLSSRPESVDELKTMIKEKLKLDYDFSLSYQDPDFDGQLCSLVDIEELPQKAVLKVVRSESDASSVASDDTIILPHAITPDRTERWPDVFPVPAFSYEVELILGSDGSVTYERTGKTVKLSRGQKHNILETIAAKMHSFKAYPNDKEFSLVAKALVSKHPCIKEPGSRTGWYGWKNSLKFKMGNYRCKLTRAGFHEVCAEFHRIANINLKNHFYAEFDRHAPRLQSLFRKKAARTGKVADVLGQLFRTYDLQFERGHGIVDGRGANMSDDDDGGGGSGSGVPALLQDARVNFVAETVCGLMRLQRQTWERSAAAEDFQALLGDFFERGPAVFFSSPRSACLVASKEVRAVP